MPTIDTSRNYLLTLNPETITFRSKTSQGTFAAPLTVTHAKRRAITKQDIEIGVAIVGKSIIFHIWKNRLEAAAGTEPAPEPSYGDEIEGAGGDGWMVSRVEIQSLGERYRCTCERKAGE